MNELLVVGAGLLLALGWICWKVGLPILQDEAKGSMSAISKAMVDRAAERLEEPERSRWQEEWYRHLEDLGDRRLYAIWWARGILRSAPRTSHRAADAFSSSNWLTLFRFGLVGGSGYVINLAVFALLAGNLGLHQAIAAIGAFCLALTNNYFWNRPWIFQPDNAHFRAARYFAVSLLALLLNLLVLELLVSTSSIGIVAAQAIAVAVAMPFNFIGNRLWTLA